MVTRVESGRFTVGKWTVSPTLGLLERNGEAVTIEPTAIAVLTYLAKRPGEVVSAAELTAAVWNNRVVGDDAVYQRIHRLRSVFHDDPQNARYIQTIPTKGYRLIAPVEFLDEQFTEINLAKRQRLIAFAFLAVPILLGVSYLIYQQSKDAASLPSIVPQLDKGNSVAVLPFVDHSDEQDQKYLGYGISEELIHTLSNVHGLRVAARTSTFRIAEMGADVRTIGEQLNVAQVLEGSIRRQGDQVRITAQLVKVADGYHIWSKTFDRNATDLIKIQQEIAAAVAESFDSPLVIDTAYSATQTSTTNVDSYDYYLLGRLHLRTETTPSLDQAVSFFRRAIELSPDFARAYSGLALAHLLRPNWLDRNEDQVLAIARSAIEQALAIDSKDAETYAALGKLRQMSGDVAGAFDAYKRAIDLDPNYAMVYYWYVGALDAVEDRDEMLEALQSLARLEPLSGRAQALMGDFYYFWDDLETARWYWRKAIELDPGNRYSYDSLVFDLFYSGQLVECLSLTNRYIESAGDDHVWNIYLDIMWIYRALYDLDAADFYLDRLLNSDVPKTLIPHERSLALMAHQDFERVGPILHSWVSDVLDEPRQLNQIAWYEMVIGHDDHARRVYDRFEDLTADSEKVVPGIDFDILFAGYYPDVNRANLLMRAHETTRAKELLARSRNYMDDNWKTTHYPSGKLHVLAAIDALEGNRTAAIDGIRKAIDAGWTRVWWTELDPNFESLRDDPEYQQIIANAKARLIRMRDEVHATIGADPSRLFSVQD